MAFEKGENPHHPALGSSTKVEPIRTKAGIDRIKRLLDDKPRDLCLFILGINTAFRANELLSLRAGQVRHIAIGDSFDLKQSKTKQYRRVTLNASAHKAIQVLLNSRAYKDQDPLFYSQRNPVLKVPAVNAMVKQWCRWGGLKGNYGSHTLRKTWGYWQYQNRTPIPLLMEAYGHQTQQQTLAYLCIQAPEIAEIYQMEL
ncbi:tyrosine-type recombinase/integrase [Acaryochloris sp. CCMEE 5410]|uniref:tyrosine-type recombinase/integrase n=1 Tax=Acaryochloris sp. CCMEE 5410 TaxID=310037 RepID=UPI0002485193|nr:tyrosine-type recombinase/integrase [Acaryochloris sp. CCMEE 5410]KAI9130016.1 tyrosine-type recombinase/integrase [Acaryochloris sp. CCMEE 5410]